MRNKTRYLKLSLLLVTMLCVPNTFAQDSPQWHLPDGAIARLGKGRISEIAYSPDGARLAVASGIGIWLYNTTTDQEGVLLTGYTSRVRSVAFSPDGTTLASGSFGEIRLWDARTGAPKRTIEGHTDWHNSVVFSPDSTTLASGSEDGATLLWELTPFVTTNAVASIVPASVPSPAIGEQLTLSLNIADGENVAGYQVTAQFDTSALRYVEGPTATSSLQARSSSHPLLREIE